MFRKVKKVKNEISRDAAKALLQSNKRGALAVNGDDGYPYAVPVNFYYDEPENTLYFHSARKGHKIDSIKNNDKVCFTTWDDGVREGDDWAYHVSSAIAFGRARLVKDAAITEEKVRKLAQKYYPSDEEVEVEIASGIQAVQLIAIKIEHLTGKRVHER